MKRLLNLCRALQDTGMVDEATVTIHHVLRVHLLINQAYVILGCYQMRDLLLILHSNTRRCDINCVCDNKTLRVIYDLLYDHLRTVHTTAVNQN